MVEAKDHRKIKTFVEKLIVYMKHTKHEQNQTCKQTNL